jgi:hypothetical protein
MSHHGQILSCACGIMQLPDARARDRERDVSCTPRTETERHTDSDVHRIRSTVKDPVPCRWLRLRETGLRGRWQGTYLKSQHRHRALEGWGCRAPAPLVVALAHSAACPGCTVVRTGSRFTVHGSVKRTHSPPSFALPASPGGSFYLLAGTIISNLPPPRDLTFNFMHLATRPGRQHGYQTDSFSFCKTDSPDKPRADLYKQQAAPLP